MKKVICILRMLFVCVRVSVNQCTISGAMIDTNNKEPIVGLKFLEKGISKWCAHYPPREVHTNS